MIKLLNNVILIPGLNPGPMTLAGTNTYLIGTGLNRILIDTGEGVEVYHKFLKELDCQIQYVLISHHHRDHTQGIGQVLSLFPQAKIFKNIEHQIDHDQISEKQFNFKYLEMHHKQIFEIEGAKIEVLEECGHSIDHMTFYEHESQTWFSCDCLLGGSSTAIYHSLSNYIKSLKEMLKRPIQMICTGHGTIIREECAKIIQQQIDHRMNREQSILNTLSEEKSIDEIRLLVYGEQNEQLIKPTLQNIRMHLEKLIDENIEQNIILQAKKLIYAQSYQEAIELLQQLLDTQESIEGYNLLAYAMKNDLENTTDGFNRAIEIMMKALEIQPNSTLTLFNLASTYFENEEYGKAIDFYSQLVNENKVSDYRVFYNLAMSYEKAGEKLEALENYQQSLKLNPNFSSAVINYANLLAMMGKQTQAKYILENYLKNNKGDMRALNNLNILLAEKQVDQKVEENFKKIGQTGAPTSIYNNGVFLSKQGKLQEALQIFKGLAERLNNDIEEPLLLLVHVNQGVIYERLGDYDAAIAKYNYVIVDQNKIIGLFGDTVNNVEFFQRIGELKFKMQEKQKPPPRIHQIAKTANNFNKPQQVKQNFVTKSPDKKLQPIKTKSAEKKPNIKQPQLFQQKKVKPPSNQTSQFDEHQSSIEQISIVQPAIEQNNRQSLLDQRKLDQLIQDVQQRKQSQKVKTSEDHKITEPKRQSKPSNTPNENRRYAEDDDLIESDSSNKKINVKKNNSQRHQDSLKDNYFSSKIPQVQQQQKTKMNQTDSFKQKEIVSPSQSQNQKKLLEEQQKSQQPIGPQQQQQQSQSAEGSNRTSLTIRSRGDSRNMVSFNGGGQFKSDQQMLENEYQLVQQQQDKQTPLEIQQPSEPIKRLDSRNSGRRDVKLIIDRKLSSQGDQIIKQEQFQKQQTPISTSNRDSQKQFKNDNLQQTIPQQTKIVKDDKPQYQLQLQQAQLLQQQQLQKEQKEQKDQQQPILQKSQSPPTQPVELATEKTILHNDQLESDKTIEKQQPHVKDYKGQSNKPQQQNQAQQAEQKPKTDPELQIQIVDDGDSKQVSSQGSKRPSSGQRLQKVEQQSNRQQMEVVTPQMAPLSNEPIISPKDSIKLNQSVKSTDEQRQNQNPQQTQQGQQIQAEQPSFRADPPQIQVITQKIQSRPETPKKNQIQKQIQNEQVDPKSGISQQIDEPKPTSQQQQKRVETPKQPMRRPETPKINKDLTNQDVAQVTEQRQNNPQEQQTTQFTQNKQSIDKNSNIPPIIIPSLPQEKQQPITQFNQQPAKRDELIQQQLPSKAKQQSADQSSIQHPSGQEKQPMIPNDEQNKSKESGPTKQIQQQSSQQPEQSKLSEQPQQPTQPREQQQQFKQPEQVKQPEQIKQPEQSKQQEQSKQPEQSQQPEQTKQSDQSQPDQTQQMTQQTKPQEQQNDVKKESAQDSDKISQNQQQQQQRQIQQDPIGNAQTQNQSNEKPSDNKQNNQSIIVQAEPPQISNPLEQEREQQPLNQEEIENPLLEKADDLQDQEIDGNQQGVDINEIEKQIQEDQIKNFISSSPDRQQIDQIKNIDSDKEPVDEDQVNGDDSQVVSNPMNETDNLDTQRQIQLQHLSIETKPKIAIFSPPASDVRDQSNYQQSFIDLKEQDQIIEPQNQNEGVVDTNDQKKNQEQLENQEMKFSGGSFSKKVEQHEQKNQIDDEKVPDQPFQIMVLPSQEQDNLIQQDNEEQMQQLGKDPQVIDKDENENVQKNVQENAEAGAGNRIVAAQQAQVKENQQPNDVPLEGQDQTKINDDKVDDKADDKNVDNKVNDIQDKKQDQKADVQVEDQKDEQIAQEVNEVQIDDDKNRDNQQLDNQNELQVGKDTNNIIIPDIQKDDNQENKDDESKTVIIHDSQEQLDLQIPNQQFQQIQNSDENQTQNLQPIQNIPENLEAQQLQNSQEKKITLEDQQQLSTNQFQQEQENPDNLKEEKQEEKQEKKQEVQQQINQQVNEKSDNQENSNEQVPNLQNDNVKKEEQQDEGQDQQKESQLEDQKENQQLQKNQNIPGINVIDEDNNYNQQQIYQQQEIQEQNQDLEQSGILPEQPEIKDNYQEQDNVAEVLYVPEEGRQFKNQSSLDSTSNKGFGKSDSQFLDDKKIKAQAKIIQYPDDYDTWTIPICLQLIHDDPKNIFAYYKLAQLYIDEQDMQKGKEQLLMVEQLDNQFEAEKVTWVLGQIFEKEKDYNKAFQYYRQNYASTSDKENCLIKVGKCSAKLDEFARSQKAYEKAILVNNKNYLPYYKLGWMQVKKGLLKIGIDNLVKAHTLKVEDIKIILKLGKAYMQYDEDSTAIEDAILILAKGLLIDPLHYECTSLIAKAYEKKGDLQNAILYAAKACEQPNSEDDSYYYLGSLYMKKKELKQAADAFRQLLKKNSKHIQALIEYGTIASIQSNFEKAKKYLKHALQLDPSNTLANQRLGRIYQTKIKDLNAAIEHYNKVIKYDDKNYKCYFFIGQCYLEKKDIGRATESMKKALNINPKYGMAWKAIGNVLYEQNSPAKAAKCFEKAIEADPSDLEAKIGLANCYYLQEQYEQALKLYEEISLLDSNEELEYNLANCYYMKNDNDDAIAHYNKALKINPNKTECFYNLGNTYCIKEQFEEALECYKRTIELDPKHSAAIYNYANAFYVLQDYDNAAKYFEQAITFQPTNVEWRNYVANLYMDKGDLQQAKRHLDESLKIQSNNPDTYVRYATYYYQIGNYKDAIKQARQALNLQEGNEEAQALLKELTK